MPIRLALMNMVSWYGDLVITVKELPYHELRITETLDTVKMR